MSAHANCQHPATKAARAKCRAARKADAADTNKRLADLVASYYDNTADTEEIMAGLNRIDPELAHDYYHGDATVEEIIARVQY